MPITEVLMGPGSWSLTLSEETPRDLLDRLQFFGHVAIHPGRLAPAQYGDNLLTTARYVGVLTGRESDRAKAIKGQGMAVWLGDSDDKGEVLEAAVVITAQTFPNAIRALLGASTAVVEGTLHSAAGTYTGRHQWQSRRKAIDYVCSTMNCEWRVNNNATLDAGPAANLFRTTPVCVIVRHGAEGHDLALAGLPGDMTLARDVEDWTTRVVLLAEGEGEATATGSADIVSNPYLDIRGNAVKRTRLVSESGTSSANAASRAQLALNRFSGTRNALRLITTDYEVRGSFVPGDWVWVYDPDSGLVDTSNEITFRGQRINPIRLRAVATSWPVTDANTVAYRAQDGSWYDLTPYVKFETGSTGVTVGELTRSLTNAGTEPVGPRPIPDTTIPGTVTWDLPFSSGVYLDAHGASRARMLVAWDLPLNADGSTILDGSHYEIRYGISPATTWSIAFAPWGTLQAEVLDLSPGVDYDFQIRAVDLAGNQGAWSATETATANPDTIAPSTPAAPTVAGSRLAIQITHTLGKASGGTYNLELDLDHLEVHVGASSGFTADATTLKGKVAAHSGMIAAGIPAIGTVQVEETTVRHVKVVAVDVAGNRSAASSSATATAQLIDSAHISDLTASKITAGTLSADIILGARIKTADTGARVEINSGGLGGWNGAGIQVFSVGTSGLVFIRSATSGARIDISTVSGLSLFNAGGVQTVSLDVDGTFELKSATSGARIQLDGTGLKAYNSSNQQTVDVSASTGAATFVGQVSTGFSGKRIIFNPAGASDPEIRFMPSSGSQVAYIKTTSSPNTDFIGMEFQTSLFADMRSNFSFQPGGITITCLGSVVNNRGSALTLGISGSTWQSTDVTTGNTSWIWLDAPSSAVFINGSNYKSFVIDNPLDDERYLIHGCTESPHSGVEYWGMAELDADGYATVVLPDYFEALTRPEGRVVLVTPDGEGGPSNATATYPRNGKFLIDGLPDRTVFWLVKAIRADGDPLIVEPRKDEVDVYGDGPYKHYALKENRG